MNNSKYLIPLLLILSILHCKDNQHSELPDSKVKEYSTRCYELSRSALLAIVIGDSSNIPIIVTDTIQDKQFVHYLEENRFDKIDSIRIYLAGLKSGIQWHAWADTMAYEPVIAVLPANYSNTDFLLVYAAGRMSLDYFEILVNYKSPEGAFVFRSEEPVKATFVGAIPSSSFYNSSGKKMPKGVKPVDIKMIYRIKGTSKIDSTMGFVDLNKND